ncbi:ankyrin repeat domain protein, putative [Entamoeba invadens IP1]|uniref:Ankyrin repeat domain protein, putative n=1 Tax=Entamoeba invadens IP1 TaxID=370355 RepID=A0A0A1UE33_ENTIV|nr:ankyrin repeat domain protein, putative [Entamoeba invadens IP1]ELP94866.1 ankyrin repeat domain protein, putative [Entamoeba invadens IP1]|eukprot:XP_004261637.1 ankyrin repeat domain protein, putative [Entamoeba invadens IP1]
MNNPIESGLFTCKPAMDPPSRPLDHTTPLHLVVYFHRHDLLRYTLSIMTIDTPDLNGKTALMIAVEQGDMLMVEQLIKFGADPCIKDGKGVCPITAAMRHGYVDIALLLLPFCTDVYQLTDVRGYTVLHYSCYANSVELCDKIAEKVDLSDMINDNCNNGVCSPLHIAAYAGSVLCCNWLIRYGARVDIENEMGETPLILALKRNHISCAEVLVLYCNTHIPDNYGQLPLHHAAAHCPFNFVSKIIDSNPGAFMCADTHGNFPVHCAMLNSDERIYDMFITNTKILCKGNSYGMTILHVAASVGNTKAVKYLLKKYTVPPPRSVRGSTPFLNSCGNNKVECMNILFENDPSVASDTDFEGCTALHYAAQNGCLEAVEWIVDRMPKMVLSMTNRKETPLHFAALGGHGDVVLFLIEKGSEISAMNIELRSPFYYSVLGGHCEVCDLLPIQKSSDKYGLTVMHAACALGHPHIVRMLCEKVPDLIEKSDLCKRSGLHIAIIYNDGISVQTLLHYGASRNVIDIRGLDPINSGLHRGFIFCYERVVGVQIYRSTIIGRLTATTKSEGGDGMLSFEEGDVIDVLWEHPSGWGYGVCGRNCGVIKMTTGNVGPLTQEEKRALDELLSMRRFGKKPKKGRSFSVPDETD